jgi:chaperonin GroEL
MSAPKDILFSNEVRNKMMDGVNKLANAVKVTLGPKGRNVFIDKIYTEPRWTKDGVTVARNIFLTDRFENVGCSGVRQAALKTSDLAGDGTTTSTVIAQAILREGIKAVAMGINPMDIKRGIDLAVEAVVSDLESHSRPIIDSSDIMKVATISANGDKFIGEMLTKAFTEVGHDGFVNVIEGKHTVTDIEIVNGISFANGYLSPSFVNKENHTCEFENPSIFLYEQNISNADKMKLILKKAYPLGRPLLILADDVFGGAIAVQNLNISQDCFKSCSVKAPSFHTNRTEILEDIALITGATLIKSDQGKVLEKNLDQDIFGSSAKVIISKDRTIIIGGHGDAVEIEAKGIALKQLLKQLETAHDVSPDYLNHIRDRVMNFKSTALIRVGGTTEAEMKERYDRFDDALNATKAAIAEGVLPGGGIALLRSISCLDKLQPLNDDIEAGIRIIRKALLAPCAQIAENAGKRGVVEVLTEGGYYDWGYDAQRDLYCDMMVEGIIDPTKVVRTALQDAASVAGLMLTTEAGITYMDSPQPMQMPIG